MFRAFSSPMKAERSRNKERLEASLAGLCELDLLKQRQECLVLSALRLGDSSVPARLAWGDLRPERGYALDVSKGSAPGDHGLRRQPSILQCTPWGIMVSLEQQVAELKVNAEASRSVESPSDRGELQCSSGQILASNSDGLPDSGYRTSVMGSYSALYPSKESVAEGTGEPDKGETSPLDPRSGTQGEDDLGEMEDGEPTEEDYQQAQRAETYMFGLIQRRAVPPRSSKPRTSLSHDTRAVTVTRQSSLCRKENQNLPMQVSNQGMPELPAPSQVLEVSHSLDHEHFLATGFVEESPHSYHHLQQSSQHQPEPYPRPRQPSLVKSPRSTSVDYQSCRVFQGRQDSSNSEPDSPQRIQNHPFPPPAPPPNPQPSPDEQLVNAEYIPAQPCRASTRTSAHHHSNCPRGSGGSKPGRSTYSPERSSHQHQEQQPTASQIQHSRSRAGPKKCRSNEDKGGASKKPGKKACRSQSENSLQRAPERKYSTMERDGGGSGSGGGGSRGSQSKGKKLQQGSGGYRRWRSTLELSQDEADQPPAQAPQPPPSAPSQRDHCARRTRKSRPTHSSYAYPHHSHSHHHSNHHQHVEYQMERDHIRLSQPDEGYTHHGHVESESSMSEADSPDSSSLSSDSDESGGLVWPQQLPPQLSLPSPPAPPGVPLQHKAFVKIKASHALKKKILRFRTGSLKVMTTV
ncbi:dapper homolog 3-like [Lampris incognitus]|uniref:dapper homolog 3-like n=1 Tax=Lampris incognitus TaxID=2546036 RepID=UPI0024B59EDA|nr:dapper homolog 3-like [Lampris incognitus]